ncbi:hypothetical protein [Streptomyces sp. NPDC001070]
MSTDRFVQVRGLPECLPALEAGIVITSIAASAGVTAGIDLALALVEEDHGRDTAPLTVARYLVDFLRRPGNQA